MQNRKAEKSSPLAVTGIDCDSANGLSLLSLPLSTIIAIFIALTTTPLYRAETTLISECQREVISYMCVGCT